MKTAMNFLTGLLALLLALSAHADDASLKIDGDLVVHPAQISNFFNLGANKVNGSTTLNWPALQFTQPYHTTWSQVQAQGPFNIQFDTSGLNTQEFSFTLTWSNPQVNVGQFEIHDTVTQTVGGANLIFHLDGICQNMVLQIPGGGWVVKGKMHYDYAAQEFVLTWEDFQLQINSSAVPQLNVGQCQGASGLIQQLHDAIVTMAQNQSWLQGVLKAGVLNWAQDTMGVLQAQMLLSRSVDVKKGLSVTWQPAGLALLPGGLLRVLGQFAMTHGGATVGADYLPRNYDMSILNAVTSSGFILPVNSLQHILSYMFATGDLTYRVNSTSIRAFQNLMSNRLMQFFVWPDLQDFATNAKFYFDLTSERAPKLQTGYMLDGGGSGFPFTAPVIVHQWAATSTQYLPYIDFRTPVSGEVSAKISNGKLSLQVQTGSLNLSATFRPEFAKIRSESTWIATSLLGSEVSSYLNSTPLNMAVPAWQVGPELSIEMSDLQAYTKSFRIPLEFKGSAAIAN